jgi:DNA polymerase/3'-5' exonuclease PolX
MSDKIKFPRAVAEAVANKIVDALRPHCERIVIAGSIRRRKELVGDIEILYVPRVIQRADPGDMFGRTIPANAADLAIHELISRGSLGKRRNKLGSETWGPENKLAIAVKTSIPVDLFSTNTKCWWNYLMCRTGSAEHNMKIATRAIELGYKWHPTLSGFSQTWQSEPNGLRAWAMTSERDIFEFLHLEYKEPWER